MVSFFKMVRDAMRPVSLSAIVSLIILLTAFSLLAPGCTGTSVSFHAAGTAPPLCRDDTTRLKTVVYWGTAWRPGQKEASRREDIIAKGVEDFFRSNPCLSVQTIGRTVNGRDVLLLGDREILASVPADIDRIHILRFEELGPELVFSLSPVLWTCDLNIDVRVRTLNNRTGMLESDVSA